MWTWIALILFSSLIILVGIRNFIVKNIIIKSCKSDKRYPLYKKIIRNEINTKFNVKNVQIDDMKIKIKSNIWATEVRIYINSILHIDNNDYQLKNIISFKNVPIKDKGNLNEYINYVITGDVNG